MLAGSQYASQDFKRTLESYSATPSMSLGGQLLGYSCSETLFGSLEVGRLHEQRFATNREAKDAALSRLPLLNQNACTRPSRLLQSIRLFEEHWQREQIMDAAATTTRPAPSI